MMCGDSTNDGDVAALMDGVKANLVVTDPPYNVAYESADGKTIQNDSMLAMALLMPVLSFAEVIVPEGTAEPAPVVMPVPVAIPSDSTITLPATGYDWASLASIAGATAFTLLFVPFVKAPLDRLWHIPARVVV